MIVNISAADTPPPPYDALAEHSFATLVGAVTGAGSTLYLNNNASLDVVGKNTVIAAIIANGVVGGDRIVGEPQWLPKSAKKPVLIVGGLISLYLVTRD